MRWMTRKLLVDWCAREIQGEKILAVDPCFNASLVYVEHAKLKGWVSKDGTKILSAGYQTAARFLKR